MKLIGNTGWIKKALLFPVTFWMPSHSNMWGDGFFWSRAVTVVSVMILVPSSYFTVGYIDYTSETTPKERYQNKFEERAEYCNNPDSEWMSIKEVEYYCDVEIVDKQ